MSSPKFFFIVGSQKCGTTYLHDCLVKTGLFSSASKKEMHFFSKDDQYVRSNFESYMSDFRENLSGHSPAYFIDSSTSYFQLPRGRVNTAQIIKEYFPGSSQLALFRNPVDRYESAFNHHILWKRIPYQEIISEVDSSHKMLSLGEYSSILKYWQEYFPSVKVYLYDDLVLDSVSFVNGVLEENKLDCRVTAGDINFRSNDSSVKLRKQGVAARKAKLSFNARKELIDYYTPYVKELEQLIGRDLSSWLAY